VISIQEVRYLKAENSFPEMKNLDSLIIFRSKERRKSCLSLNFILEPRFHCEDLLKEEFGIRFCKKKSSIYKTIQRSR